MPRGSYVFVYMLKNKHHCLFLLETSTGAAGKALICNSDTIYCLIPSADSIVAAQIIHS